MAYSKLLKVYGVCLICSMLVLYLLSERLSSSPALLYFIDLLSKRMVLVLLAKRMFKVQKIYGIQRIFV